MSTATHLATIADLEAHPGRCELINGEIVEMAPTGYEHGASESQVAYELITWARTKPFRVLTGDTGFIWDEHTVRAPDVAVISKEQAQQAPRRGFLPFAPVLAVEVVSPGDSLVDVQEKAAGWLVHGVQMVWIVEPKRRTVEVWLPGDQEARLKGDAVLDGGEVLPGFSCPVARFFED